MTDRIELPEITDFAPELPPKGPWVWARENLFSTVASTVLTVVFAGIVIVAIRSAMDFVFDQGRRWDAVTTNLRLMMIQAYPSGPPATPISQIHRIWLSVAIVAVLIAFSLAVYRVGGKWSRKQLGGVFAAIGTVALIGGILGPFSFGARAGWLITGAVLAGVGYVLRQGESAKQETIPVLGIITSFIGLIIIGLWTVSVPVPEITANADAVTGFDQGIRLDGIASTTAMPWTAIAIALVAAYFIGVAVRERVSAGLLRGLTMGVWVLSFPVMVLVILRDPEIDYGSLVGDYVLPGLGFAVLGAVLLYYLSSGVAGEAGRALAVVFLIIAIATFFFSTPFIYRWLLLSFAIFGLMAPSFGAGGARNKYVAIWVSWVAVLSYFVMLIAADSTVEVPGSFFLGGLMLTFLISITAIVASFPLGVMLALARTSTMPIFRLMATAYIEVIRGVPLITWLIVASVMLPVALPRGIEVNTVMRAIAAITFFNAAYLAENVRGGLQAVSKGQSEAAKALGMSTVQMTVFITLPQALRAVIPALVGQVIALFKDTSLVTIISLFDLLHIARSVIPTQTQPVNFLGSIKETLIIAAVIYWIFTFTTSRISLRLEKKLGVGER